MFKIDPFLSSKIFDSEIYQNSNDIEKDLDIDTRINHEIYGNVDYNPVYFQGENTNSALNSFVSSEAFNTFKKELSNIEQHLKNWLGRHPMQIKISYWRNGEKLWSESPADRVIGIFFSRLAGDYYGDARIQLYADGKKKIETLAVLIHYKGISIDRCQAILHNLLSDEGLLACAAGCYTRLSDTVNYLFINLKTKIRLSNWIYEYLIETADTLMHNKVSTFQDTYLQILCHLVNSPIDEWEVHAKNYLLLFIVNQGGFPFHNFILDDVFISQFKRHSGIKRIAELYLSELQKTINHKQLTNYIANKLYSLLENEIFMEDYSEQANIINQYLDALGSDEYFELGEVFSEDGAMRDIRSFEMTITERLMHNGWFNSNRVFSPKKNTLQSIFYKLFQDNFLLTWIKKRGHTRIRLKNIEINEETLEDIKIFWHSFISNEKLILLRCCMPEMLLGYSKPHRFFSTKLFYFFVNYKNIKVFKEWDLRSVCFQNHCFYTQVEQSDVIFKKMKLNFFRKLDFSNVMLQGVIFKNLDFSEAKFINANLQLANLKNIAFKSSDLSGIDLNMAKLWNVNFYKANLRRARLQRIFGRELNFNHADLSSEIVKVDLTYSTLIKTNFVSSNLKDVDFTHANLLDCDFTYSNLDHVDFSNANLQGSIFGNAQLKTTKLLNTKMREVDLEGADLEGINLANIDFQDSKLVKVNLKNTILQNAKLNGVDLEGADFTGADLSGADLAGANLVGAHLTGAKNVNLEGVDLTGVNLIGVDLLNSNFEASYINRLTSDNVPDQSLHNLENTQHNSIENSNEILEENLEFATIFYKNYAYALKKNDLESIAEIFFLNEQKIFFQVISSSAELVHSFNLFNQHKNIKNWGIFIIRQRKNHWASLLVYFHLTNLNTPRIYFIDSLGQVILPSFKRFIRNYYPQATCIELLSSKPQTTLVYDSGLWSLENSLQVKHIIEYLELSKEYLQDSSLISFLDEKLYENIVNFGKNYFENQRISLSVQLLKAPNRIQKFKKLLKVSYDMKDIKIKLACLPKITKRTIDERACLFDWEDIDKINLEKIDTRNVNKIKVDSVLFIDFINKNDVSESEIQKLWQLLDWLDIKNIEIVGSEADSIKRLIFFKKMAPYVMRLKYMSDRLNLGLFMEDTIAAWVRGDAQSVAMNVGFIVANVFSSHLADVVKSGGTALVKGGRLVLGDALKSSAPFLRRGTSIFFAYDLYSEIKRLQGGDKEVIPDIVTNSIILGADMFQVGIELAELAEVEAALGTAGPIGLFIDGIITFVIVGSKIYSAVDTVDRINKITPLTGFEKFKEGWLAFLSLGPEYYIKESMDLVQANNQLLLAKLEILKRQPHIAHYFYVPIEKVHCNAQSPNCTKPFSYFQHVRGYLHANAGVFILEKRVPEKPVGIEFACLPYVDLFNTDERGVQLAYYCENFIGITNVTNQIADTALLDFEDGSDHLVIGLRNKKNFFLIRNGNKTLQGGKQEDFFKIAANSSTGKLSGGLGRDTLDLSEFFPLEQNIMLDLTEKLLSYGQKELVVEDIEVFIGRKAHSEAVVVACNTLELNMQGGLLNDRDSIDIPQNASCHYSLKVILHSNTVVSNRALSGNFAYIILPEYGLITVDLPPYAKNNTHQFFINGTMNDLASISVKNSTQVREAPTYDITVRFLSASIQELIQLIKSIQIFKKAEKQLVEIIYNFNEFTPVTSMNVLRKAGCLPLELKSEQYLQFLEPNHDLPTTFNLTKSHREDIYFLVLTLLRTGICPYPIENTIITIKSISTNNTYFYFSDKSTLQIGGEDNVYVHVNLNQTMDYIKNTYLDAAKRLKVTFIAYSDKDNFSLIAGGYNKSEVMQLNNVALKNYFISHGGENIFVINSGYENLTMLNQTSLPIREIIIDSEYSEKYKDTIDFRPFFNQVKRDLNATLKIDIKLDTKTEKFENDVFMIFKVNNFTRTTDIQFFNIRLKNALFNQNFKNIQFILNVAPMQIMGSVPHLYAEPVFLEFDVHSNFVFLSSRDVEKNTLVIFNRLFDGHEFLRANEHLFISNILNRKTETKAVSTLFLTDFYKDPTLSTLKIKFFNKKLILRDKLHQINKAIDLSAFFANEAKDLEALFNQTGLLTKNKYNIVSHIYLNNTLTKNLSLNNQIISRQSRFIREVKEPMASGVERSRGVIQTLAGGITHCFFFDKKKPALSFHVNQLACFPNLKNCSAADKPKKYFKSTQLSTKLINVSLRWTTLQIELGTGALSGSVGAIFDKLMDVYPHREMSLTIMSTVLDSLIVSTRYFSPALVNHEIESEGSFSLFAIYFTYNLFIINSLRKILLSLEYSDKPIYEQIKNGIQVLYKIFFLYVMFNFFTSEEDCVHKLTILSNLVCYSGASMVSRQLTHAVLNSDFFKTNSREHPEDQVENSEVTKLSGIFKAP